MTGINKPLTRRTAATFREQGRTRSIIITLEPSGIITMRLAGCRRREQTTVEAMFDVAVKARLRAEARDKKNRRLSR